MRHHLLLFIIQSHRFNEVLKASGGPPEFINFFLQRGALLIVDGPTMPAVPVCLGVAFLYHEATRPV